MSSKKVPITSKNALFCFYVIESLSNAFTLCAYTPRMNDLRIFYLVDPESLLSDDLSSNSFDECRARQVTINSNPALLTVPALPKIFFHDLSTWNSNRILASIMGLSDADNVNNPESSSTYTKYFRPVCDTDYNYNPILRHPYLAGYHSANYDTVMISLYLMEAFSHVNRAAQQQRSLDYGFTPPTPQRLHKWSDELSQEPWKRFMPKFLVEGSVANGRGWDSTPHRIRQAMISSGRHIDIACFNETQQRVSLKHVLGGLGHQIIENKKLGTHNIRVDSVEDFYELLAYNVSDAIGLTKLLEHPTYSSGFDLKKGLIDEYPETVYQRHSHSYKSDVRPERVRKDRLVPDSSSAKIVGRILAPYEPLKDLEGVSYIYPCDQVARTTGIKQVNVLEESRRFFYDKITSEDARAQFDKIYKYYKSIEGKNFNDSSFYDDTWGLSTHPPHQIKDIPKVPNNLPYFHMDGTPSSCFVSFSTGGIHGTAVNLPLFEEDVRAWREKNEMLYRAKQAYPDAQDLVNADRDEHNRIVLTDGFVVDSKVVLTEQDQSRSFYHYVPVKSAPEMFETRSDGSTKLKARYSYTSVEKVIHQDFKSYYPLLLRNMGAFHNPNLGVDRYAKLYADKEYYEDILKESILDPAERKYLKVLRDGIKLILNTASGAGDTQFSAPIRMNNRIISMRIIGQLFCWRIGQTQTLAGARVISTNTDGLYSVLDTETNNAVLKHEASVVGVDIESKPLTVVSKDSNNRLELAAPKDGDKPLWRAPIISASGGSLACHDGPQPTKSMNRPAVLDWALARYLSYVVGNYTPPWRDKPLSLDEPLDQRMGLQLMHQARALDDPAYAVRLFQNVVAASVDKLTFPFAADPIDPLSGDVEKIKNPRPLQHYNRILVVKQGELGACSLRTAGAWEVTDTSRLKRERNGQALTITEPVALKVLRANGFVRTRLEAHQYGQRLLPVDHDVMVRTVPGVDPEWSVLIENGDLLCMPEARLRALLGCLALDVYVEMLATSYNRNWKRSSVAKLR